MGRAPVDGSVVVGLMAGDGGPESHLGEPLCSVGLHAGHDVAVGVERERDRAVAQSFRDDFGVNADTQQKAGVSRSGVVVVPMSARAGPEAQLRGDDADRVVSRRR